MGFDERAVAPSIALAQHDVKEIVDAHVAESRSQSLPPPMKRVGFTDHLSSPRAVRRRGCEFTLQSRGF